MSAREDTVDLFADDPRRDTSPAARAKRAAREAARMVGIDPLAARLPGFDAQARLADLPGFDAASLFVHPALGGGRMCRTHPAVRHLAPFHGAGWPLRHGAEARR